MNRVGRSLKHAGRWAPLFIWAVVSILAESAHAQILPPHPTMVFYVATGDSDACAADCGQWIVAEGPIGVGSVARLRAVLDRLGKEKLPVFFDSGGGFFDEALDMGKLLRQRGLTAGIAKTIPAACSNTQDCEDLKRSGKIVKATKWPEGGRCNSTCVYAFVGAEARLVGPDARIAVHATRLAIVKKNGRIDSVDITRASTQQKVSFNRFDTTLKAYFLKMGIDVRLADLVKNTPFDQLHYLTREEIVKFGIDRVADH